MQGRPDGLSLRRPFEQFSDHLSGVPHNPPAFHGYFTFVEGLGLFPVFPVHPGDFPAENAPVVLSDLPESLENLLGIGPHFGIFFFILPGAAESQSHNRQGTGKGPADLSISPQAAAESSHGFDDFVVFPPQLLLPDRKNGLASVKPLHHHLHGLFPHLFPGHFPPHPWLLVLL
jgi:hypothetical protein